MDNQHDSEIGSAFFTNGDASTLFVLELFAINALHARGIALAMHEKLCERGDLAQAEQWESVLNSLPRPVQRSSSVVGPVVAPGPAERSPE